MAEGNFVQRVLRIMAGAYGRQEKSKDGPSILAEAACGTKNKWKRKMYKMR